MSRRVFLPCAAAVLAVFGLQAARAESPAVRLSELLGAETVTAPVGLIEAAAAITATDVRGLAAAEVETLVGRADGITALMPVAAFNTDPAVAQALIDAGADVAAREANGWSALMYAAAFNPDPEVVQVLLDGGAALRTGGATAIAPYLRVPGSHAVLDRVAELQRRGTLPMASTHGGETALLLAAAYNGNAAVVRTVAAAGADVRRADGDGSTALLYAAWFNPSVAVHRTLLRAGADINARDNRARTALIAAAAGNPNPEVVQTLLDAGAEVSARDEQGWTPRSWPPLPTTAARQWCGCCCTPAPTCTRATAAGGRP